MQVEDRAQGYQVNKSVRKHVYHVHNEITVADPALQVIITNLNQCENGKGADDCYKVADREGRKCNFEEAALLGELRLAENARQRLRQHTVES